MPHRPVAPTGRMAGHTRCTAVLSVVYAVVVASACVGASCPFGFSACASQASGATDAAISGACAMFVSACGNCTTGELVCPGTGGASGRQPVCVPATDAGYLLCPLPAWRNTSLPTAQRVAAIVDALTLVESAAQLINTAPAIERLGVPAYNWWNEGLHGVAFSGLATMFPQVRPWILRLPLLAAHAATSRVFAARVQVILTAASFDEELWSAIGRAIADEGRGKHNQCVRRERA